MIDMLEYLGQLPYPGRGIMIGKDAQGASIVAYFIMGRSENSRNRIFESTDDGIRTKAYDESKMEDPSLIIYHPVRLLSDGRLVVTNGDQTDTVADALKAGGTFEGALRTRTFEPDGPNWTPRISGLLEADGGYRLSILKSLEGSDVCSCRYFFEYDAPQKGFGHFISTYEGKGDPIPSYPGEPVYVGVPSGSLESIASQIWEALNEDNKVSLYVARRTSVNSIETVILNKHE